MEKKLYAIFHGVDEDGGYGDAVFTESMIGVVQATAEEIAAFVEKWNKPTVYGTPYADLYCHNVRAEEIEICDLRTLNPYGEGDYYGLQAKIHKFTETFDVEHGSDWRYTDQRFKLYELRSKAIEEIRKKHEEEQYEQK